MDSKEVFVARCPECSEIITLADEESGNTEKLHRVIYHKPCAEEATTTDPERR